MSVMVQFFPSRTVALGLFGFDVHWYGLMYLLGFLIAWYLLPRLQKYRDLSLTRDDWANVLAWAVIGVIVGGRLGYVFFYQPLYFLDHPDKIIAIWEGGMSSHGGFIGVTIALLWALRMQKGNLLAIADTVVVPVAIGLALGRIGNFINQELYGTITSLPWGITVPDVVGLRHPTQIYAVFKDLFIAGVCYWYLKYSRPVLPGRTCALFLMLYGVLRFLLEYVRIQEYPLIDVGVLLLSRGQILTLGILVVGVGMWWRVGRRG